MDFSKAAAIEVIYPEYNSAEFFWAVHAKEDDPKRCSLCWHLRLAKAAQAAKERGFTHFSTTLLVSPYQDQGLLKEIGDGIAKEEAVGFYYEDFRPGFQKAHDEARAKGIYCQKYCGCIYSEVEQCKKSPGH
jgi:predicted adenine nucleotide alpha hydrolase (AANH) superfamily ATPase